MYNKKFNDNEKAVTARIVNHGDWKTASVFPDRYKPIPENTEVKVIRTWSNCYGLWVRVEGPNGSHYDVREDDLHKVWILQVGDFKLDMFVYLSKNFVTTHLAAFLPGLLRGLFFQK